VNAPRTRLERLLHRRERVRFQRALPRPRLLRFSRLSLVAVFVATVPGHALPCEEGAPAAARTGVAVTPAISVGTWDTCAVGADGLARCWGTNLDGELGVSGLRSSATPVRVPIEHVVDVAAGYLHTCALDVEGVVWCWGANRDGELGDGTRQDRAAPAPVRGLSDVTGIAAGAYRACAVRVDGAAFCWGNGILGALGDGRNDTSDLPVPVTGITDAVAIAVGEDHACAVHVSGRVSCWGRNTWGQLGDGSNDESNVPRVVKENRSSPGGWVTTEIDDAVAVGAGYAHTCVLHADGRVSCWGANWYGQLGDGSTSGTSWPVQLAKLSRVKAIAVGNLDSCALLSDGTARCWGSNGSGQLGDGATQDALEPVTPQLGSGDAARPLGGLVAIRTGDDTCAVDVSGAMWCWGAGYTGQLGDGAEEDRAVPGLVLPLP
jgi:alpha-tubulin suppressor-like RCC1 family protein